MSSQQVLVHITILINFICTTASQFDYCKLCEACVEDVVVCSKPAFQQMPMHMSKTTKRFILQNQQFSNNFLTRVNFSHLKPPEVYLHELIIRKSNINLIKSETFSDLIDLKNIDLTYNIDLYIESRSFSGLNLRLLKLDHNDILKFDVDAFVNLQLESLHMSHSSITALPYGLLQPILPYLKKLFLNNNKLVVLDQRFQNHFKNLQNLDLQENPFICSCSMKWLTAVYMYRSTNGKYSKVSFNDDTKVFPVCKSPKYMEGRHMNDVPLSMYNCDPPNLTQLKIDFQSATETELSCAAVQNVDQASMSVNWFSEIINEITRKITFVLKPDTMMNINKKVHTGTVLIHKNKSVDSFRCVAKNLNGNATAIVRISWPPNDKSVKQNQIFYQSTIDSWQKSDDENYLFQKRFTLLEMFGAVFGTFAITLIIFFMIYKLVFINRHIDRKAMLQPNGYTTYEAALYSDSQTYDIPSNSYQQQSILLPMPHLSSTPDHFIDFKTQKKFYQTT